MIEQNKYQVQQEKEQAYQKHKNNLNNSIIMRKTALDSFCESTKQQYNSKVSQKQRDAQELERKMKELEKHEQAMIQKLQNTYKKQQNQFTKLNQVKSIQVPKASLRFDNYYYHDVKQAQSDAEDKAQEYMMSFDVNQDGFIAYAEVINSAFFENRQEAVEYAQTFFVDCGHDKERLQEAKISKDQLRQCILNILTQQAPDKNSKASRGSFSTP